MNPSRQFPKLLLVFVLFLLLFSACHSSLPAGGTSAPTSSMTPAETLPPAPVSVTRVPDAKSAAEAFLSAWKKEDYTAMYALLNPAAQSATSAEAFTTRYQAVANEAALSGIDYEVLSAQTSPRSAQVGFRVILHSRLVVDITRENHMNLSIEDGQWRVQWDDGLILPELSGGNRLKMDYKIPARQDIYDRYGNPLVAQADAVAIGLDAGNTDPDQDDAVLTAIYRLLGIRPDDLRLKLEAYRANGWYLPIGDVSAAALKRRGGGLAGYSGVQLTPFTTRYYFEAPHVTGYTSLIQKGKVEDYKRLGYSWTERVPRDGLELWGDSYLGGKRGGTLSVVNPDGSATLSTLADSPSGPSEVITTTIDSDLQFGAQQAIAGFKGAVVVMELDTGKVRTLVSSPGYDPNLFEPENFNVQFPEYVQAALYGDDQPMFNRATQGQYPLGSVFKIITMAAGLKSGVYTPQSTYECGYQFTELPDVTLNDWTYDHFQKDGETQPSGHLTLPEGLMRSCNPFFYHIGLDLFDRGMRTAISDMARGFGLGSPTGFELKEEPGNVPVPQGRLEATNNAIGQGQTLVTPLQVADFIAAVGNGGTLYQPTVIQEIASPSGALPKVFNPVIRGTLPISGTMLTEIQKAMVSVIKNSRGTANNRFRGFSIPVAGKTGTAEAPEGVPDAWFAGYSFANNPDKPDIAVAVLVENIGEGSDYAAPIFRRVMEEYFYGRPLSLYWWEQEFGVKKTETPEATSTPSVEETPTPQP